MKRELKRIAITLGVLAALAIVVFGSISWATYAMNQPRPFLVYISPYVALIALCIWQVVGAMMRSAERESRDKAGE